jgi:hypothetical protein
MHAMQVTHAHTTNLNKSDRRNKERPKSAKLAHQNCTSTIQQTKTCPATHGLQPNFVHADKKYLTIRVRSSDP